MDLIKVDNIKQFVIYFFSLDSSCRTISHTSGKNPDANKKCIFPFKYQEKEFRNCTTAGNTGVFWCATEVSVDGSYVSGKWGICTEECPKEGNKYNTGVVTDKHLL